MSDFKDYWKCPVCSLKYKQIENIAVLPTSGYVHLHHDHGHDLLLSLIEKLPNSQISEFVIQAISGMDLGRFKSRKICSLCNATEASLKVIPETRFLVHKDFSFSVDELRKIITFVGGRHLFDVKKALQIYSDFVITWPHSIVRNLILNLEQVFIGDRDLHEEDFLDQFDEIADYIESKLFRMIIDDFPPMQKYIDIDSLDLSEYFTWENLYKDAKKKVVKRQKKRPVIEYFTPYFQEKNGFQEFIVLPSNQNLSKIKKQDLYKRVELSLMLKPVINLIKGI